MVDSNLHIFGIRHHGPGSARSLEAALEQLQPARILIEGPPEANELIKFAGHPQMLNPLAILVYASQDPSYASFYPFADYSPEWRAMLWANAQQIPAEFIDLPQASRFAQQLSKTETPPAELTESDAPIAPEFSADSEAENVPPARVDPFQQLAQLAGYDDAEAWWNEVIEETQQGGAHFAALEQAVAELRRDVQESKQTLQREAYMRQQIRRVLKETAGPVAVICGAWHAPALRDLGQAKADQKLLGRLAKTKTEATWTPWSDRHLAFASGYGAGVASPGWYRFLWQHGSDTQSLASHWQSHVARLLRAEGLSASTAAVIEAVRLSTSLAALRGRPAPSLQEMNDASLAVVCGGDEMPLRLIQERLVIGTAVGTVADEVPQPPLQADLSRQLKKYRLSLETVTQEISLDLRTEAGIAKSILFNRLNLLDIPWATLQHNSSRGTFRENWRLSWEPEFSIKLNEAIRFGPTIARAAQNSAIAQIMEAPNIAVAAELIEACLLADLPQAAEQAMGRLENLSVQGNEVNYLIEGVIPLILILRYGTARPIPEAALSLLTLSMVREALIRLPYATHNLDEQEAQDMMKRLADFHHTLHLLDHPDIMVQWQNVQRALLNNAACFPGIKGLVARFLYDRGQLTGQVLHNHLAGALSYGTPPLDGARWLEGFLSGTADIILLDETLFNLMNEWLLNLPEDTFLEMLPLIRRAFADFGQSQRHRLLQKVRSGPVAGSSSTGPAVASNLGQAYFDQAYPLLALILDLPAHDN